MKNNLYLLASLLLLIVLLSCKAKKNNANNQLKTINEGFFQESGDIKWEKEGTYKWSDLAISPDYNQEGDFIGFSDVSYRDQSILFSINDGDSGKVLLFNHGRETRVSTQYIYDVEFVSNEIWVVTSNEIRIYDKGLNTLNKTIEHGIKDIYWMDKIIVHQGIPQILMSNGTSYALINNEVIRSSGLLDSQGVTRELYKLSGSQFEIRTNKGEVNAYQAEGNTGSLSFLGFVNKTMVIEIDQVLSETPMRAIRRISSSEDQFRTFLEAPIEYGYHTKYIVNNSNLFCIGFNTEEIVVFKL